MKHLWLSISSHWFHFCFYWPLLFSCLPPLTHASGDKKKGICHFLSRRYRYLPKLPMANQLSNDILESLKQTKIASRAIREWLTDWIQGCQRLLEIACYIIDSMWTGIDFAVCQRWKFNGNQRPGRPSSPARALNVRLIHRTRSISISLKGSKDHFLIGFTMDHPKCERDVPLAVIHICDYISLLLFLKKNIYISRMIYQIRKSYLLSLRWLC